MLIQLPEHINLSHPEWYILHIEISSDRVAFAIYNPVENGSYFYYPLPESKQNNPLELLKEAFFDNEFLALPYRKVNVLNRTKAFTYVPSILFDEKDKAEYMNFLFLGERGKLLDHTLQHLQLSFIHEINEAVYEFIQRSFVGVRFFHHTAPLIAYFHDRVRTVNAGRMMVNIHDDSIDIVCFHRDALLLGNCFECSGTTDAAYYILYTWKQLKFDQEKDFIYIAGNPESRKEMIEQLKEYIHNLIPVNVTPEAHFEQVDTGRIPFELAALSLCEL